MHCNVFKIYTDLVEAREAGLVIFEEIKWPQWSCIPDCHWAFKMNANNGVFSRDITHGVFIPVFSQFLIDEALSGFSLAELDVFYNNERGKTTGMPEHYYRAVVKFRTVFPYFEIHPRYHEAQECEVVLS